MMSSIARLLSRRSYFPSKRPMTESAAWRRLIGCGSSRYTTINAAQIAENEVSGLSITPRRVCASGVKQLVLSVVVVVIKKGRFRG